MSLWQTPANWIATPTSCPVNFRRGIRTGCNRSAGLLTPKAWTFIVTLTFLFFLCYSFFLVFLVVACHAFVAKILGEMWLQESINKQSRSTKLATKVWHQALLVFTTRLTTCSFAIFPHESGNFGCSLLFLLAALVEASCRSDNESASSFEVSSCDFSQKSFLKREEVETVWDSESRLLLFLSYNFFLIF